MSDPVAASTAALIAADEAAAAADADFASAIARVAELNTPGLAADELQARAQHVMAELHEAHLAAREKERLRQRALSTWCQVQGRALIKPD
jgi:hypothetical protein